MLTHTSRDVKASAIIPRPVPGTVPPAVADQVTRLGQRLPEPIELLDAWGRDNATAPDQPGSRASSRWR